MIADACVRSAILLSAFALVQAGKVHVVTQDMGGSVMARYREINELRLQRTKVEIRGNCMSSCTMYLGLPDICVTEDASLGFHGPRNPGSNQPLPNSTAAKLMAAHYPEPIKVWFIEEAQYLPGGEVALLSGKQLIALGIDKC